MLKNRYIILLGFTIIITIFCGCATAQKQQHTLYSSEIKHDNTIAFQQRYPTSILRVATLNLAHGRKDSFSQLFVTKSTHKENLNDISNALIKYKPDVVALQEADIKACWSGNFNHVSYLATAANYSWKIDVGNVDTWMCSYGTALLSTLPFIETIKYTFEPSPPTLNKGFVLAQVQWPSSEEARPRKVDIISAHLDFSRQSVREKQIKELQEVLSKRMNPTIIMGDFNSEWFGKDSVIKELSTQSRFSSYKPESSHYDSYKDKRLDWILITNDMEFVNYKVLPDILSDHLMVVAEIRFKNKPTPRNEPHNGHL